MEENNKLIAEFMGISIDGEFAYIEDEGSPLEEVMPINKLKYHLSWDWLIPVVQKIGDEYYNTPFDETYSRLTEQYENIWTLEDTYNAVVEFIKDYNNGKN
jgi:hypothetical protein